MKFPKWKYHAEKEARIVESPEDEARMGHGWTDSPADHGVETCPGVLLDSAILARKQAGAPRAKAKRGAAVSTEGEIA